jgi:hypothetical protein
VNLRQISGTIKDNAERCAKLDVQLGKCIFSANVPFNFVENKEFLHFCKMMRPSYSPPSAKQINSSILEKVYEDIMDENKIKLKSKFATIMQDGWTGSQRNPIISHSLSVDSRTVFLDAVSASNEKKTSEFCLSLLEKSIDEAEWKFGCIIIAVVTDNYNSMLRMRRLISERRSDVWVYGCHTHYLNLVGKQLISNDILEFVKKVQHHFMDNTYCKQTLRLKRGYSPVLPNATRWTSNFDCLENYVKNHSLYLDIGKEKDAKVPDDILTEVMNLQKYARIQKIIDKTRPLVSALVQVCV